MVLLSYRTRRGLRFVLHPGNDPTFARVEAAAKLGIGVNDFATDAPRVAGDIPPGKMMTPLTRAEIARLAKRKKPPGR